jgi:signal transduction histidine kinase
MRSTGLGEAATRAVAVSDATVALTDVDILAQLDTRPSRVPNYEREHRAFALLSAELSERPRNMLQKLVEVAVQLCDAHTAGISLLDGDVFRWEAVAGVFAGARGGTMPRDQSPCGICIDRGSTQLMHLPDRCFPALASAPRFVEALLIPFYSDGRAVGTVWIVSHTHERTFDREDERIVRVLSQMASAGWQLWRAGQLTAEHNHRKDVFLAMLGHELRNPLSAIQSGAEVLRHGTSDPRTTRPAVEIISRQAAHMSKLLDDLLDVARIDSGKVHLERRSVDVRAVVTATLASFRPQFERRRHVLTAELGHEPLLVTADPLRMSQVISNLVDNAAKYTPNGGQVRVETRRDGDHVAVTVADSGVGVPADQLENIFEPFTQLKETHQWSNGGLGLGLALVRSLTELHGGTVKVVSGGSDQGSAFTVRWPTGPPGA